MPAVTATAAALPESASPRGMAPRERAALLLLVVSGACFLPGALDRFVFPKLAVAAIGVMLALTVPGRGRLPREVIGMLGLGGLLLLVAALTSAAPLAQLLGRSPRYEGVVGLSVYLGALIAGARLLGARQTPGASAWMLDVLSVAALAIGIEAALEATGLRPLASNVSRPGSLLGNASDQGAWAVLALGPLAIAAFTFREKLHVAGAVAAAVALATSGSRGALAGAVAVVAVLALCRPPRAVVIGLACGVVVVAAGVLALPASRARVLQTSPLAQQTTKGRTLLWSETASLVVDHPLLGVGPSGYVDAIPAYHDRRYEREVGPQNPPDSPHNWILQAASAGGVLLALLAVALAGLDAPRRMARRPASRPGARRSSPRGCSPGSPGTRSRCCSTSRRRARRRWPRCMPGRCSRSRSGLVGVLVARVARCRFRRRGWPRPRTASSPSCSWRRRSRRSRCARPWCARPPATCARRITTSIWRARCARGIPAWRRSRPTPTRCSPRTACSGRRRSGRRGRRASLTATRTRSRGSRTRP